MSYAQVESIDALKAFKSVLWKFADTVAMALSDADGELSRSLNWLETEQQAHWQDQIRKRTELVARAREAVRAKKMFRRADGSRPTAIEEEKALAIAVRRLEEAHQKLAVVRRYARQLQKEILLYNGQVQRLANAVHSGIPMAAGHLDQLIAALESYVGPDPFDRNAEGSDAALSEIPANTRSPAGPAVKPDMEAPGVPGSPEALSHARPEPPVAQAPDAADQPEAETDATGDSGQPDEIRDRRIGDGRL